MQNLRGTLVFLLLIVLVTGLQAQPETRRVQVRGLGVLDIPQGWVRIDKPNGTVVLQDSTAATGVRLAKVTGLKHNGAPSYLRMRANELGISDYIRGIDQGLKNEAGADLGSYVLGTTRLGGDSVLVPFDPNSFNEDHKGKSEEGSSLETPEPQPSRYFLVIAYTRGKQVYTMEGWSVDLPKGALVLTDIHRSWRLPGSK